MRISIKKPPKNGRKDGTPTYTAEISPNSGSKSAKNHSENMNDFIFLNLILTSAQGEYINLFPAKQQKIGLNNFFYTVKNLDSPGCPCEAP